MWGDVFGCREASLLSERQVTHVQEGSGLAAEEEGGMVRMGEGIV